MIGIKIKCDYNGVVIINNDHITTLTYDFKPATFNITYTDGWFHIINGTNISNYVWQTTEFVLAEIIVYHSHIYNSMNLSPTFYLTQLFRSAVYLQPQDALSKMLVHLDTSMLMGRDLQVGELYLTCNKSIVKGIQPTEQLYLRAFQQSLVKFDTLYVPDDHVHMYIDDTTVLKIDNEVQEFHSKL